tara:strand:- start:154 stop:744 length:591 start_codon:yes stop_codon:yes gene_type:complete
MKSIKEINDNLQSFAQTYITYPTHQCSIVTEGLGYIRASNKLQNSVCCGSGDIAEHVWCELEYWTIVVKLIVGRMEAKKKNKKIRSTCESYQNFRYRYIALPTILYPNRNVSVVKTITLFFLAVSGLIQLLRVQLIDSKVSFWAQITYLIGSLVTIFYFAIMQNFDLAIPYVGGSILCILTIAGIFMHDPTPWSSL